MMLSWINTLKSSFKVWFSTGNNQVDHSSKGSKYNQLKYNLKSYLRIWGRDGSQILLFIQFKQETKENKLHWHWMQ